MDKTLLNFIAKRSKHLREAKGVTQQEMSNLTGMNIGRIETGERDIQVSSLKKMCDYYGVSIAEFFSEQ